jgi:hypothetical protein
MDPMDRVEMVTESGCWIWMGGLNSSGYGPHRRFWERANGRVPAGLEIDHRCEVECCVCPGHMRPVTHAENKRLERMRNAGRPCRNGHLPRRNKRGQCLDCNAENARAYRRRGE